jgi:hypothetical protein
VGRPVLDLSNVPAGVTVEVENCYTDGVQLHQDSNPVWCTIHMHVEQSADKNGATGSFTGTIFAKQYNE